jgi:PilZ domain
MSPAIHDRRRAPRATLSIPVRVRPSDSSCPEEICKTLNVSRTGLYFETSAQHYLRDMNVYVTRNFRLFDPTNSEEKGSIVRVERRKSGKWGVVVRIPTTSKRKANANKTNDCRSVRL